MEIMGFGKHILVVIKLTPEGLISGPMPTRSFGRVCGRSSWHVLGFVAIYKTNFRCILNILQIKMMNVKDIDERLFWGYLLG
jgi:hypothetical protein